MSNKDNIPKVLAQAMSSEHTSYGSTKKYLKKLPTTGKYVIQGPGENAGIVDLGQGWALAIRIESHNHPSFIKPYHGAATGVGGILRDIFTMGARPIGLLDFLRFGTDNRAKKLFKEVVRGIADYGDCVGVPVVGGDLFFDATYNHNCLVNVAAFGLVKKKNIIYGNALSVGSDLIYVGARTGRDGIGGAQMASANLNVLDERAVQEADPFLEKLLLEACGELAQTDWIEGMQDMGAAGLLCSTTEVVRRGQKKTGKNLGARVYLNRVPTKATNMTPVEMLLSESQERMLIVGKRKYRSKILKLFKHWDLEAVVVGEVVTGGKYTIVYDQKGMKNISLVMDLDKIIPDVETPWKLVPQEPQKSKSTSGTMAQKKYIWQQYDWMVGTRTIKGPDMPGQYAIMAVPEVDSELVVCWGSDPAGEGFAFDKCFEQMKNLKARPLGLTNCLNFGHPKESMWVFVKTIDVLAKRCREFNVPVVSGNVSLYNSYKNHSIKPTAVLVMVGLRKNGKYSPES